MNKISGVYKITNNVTGDFYIGSSKNIKQRWYNHKCLSYWVRYSNSRMYRDMAQYGLNNFTFEVIEETNELKEREQYFIKQMKPTYNDRRVKITKTERLSYNKEWYENHRAKQLDYCKEYGNRICIYDGETLTLKALSLRLYKQGISHATIEAKKYLINE